MRETARERALRRIDELLQKRQAREVAGRGLVHETTLSRWRNGKAPFNPTLTKLERLAAGLGVTVSELVGEAPTFDEKLRSMTTDEKLALMQRLAEELRAGRS